MASSWLPTAAPRRSEREAPACAGDLACRLDPAGGRTDQVSHTTRSSARCRPPSRCRGTLRMSSACSPGNCAQTQSNDHGCPRPMPKPSQTRQSESSRTRKRARIMSSISIIGTGNMARTIGTLAVAGGNTVEVTGRDQSKAADLAKALGGGATTGEWGAVPAGDIVIVAVLYDSVVPIVAEYGDALAGKAIIDISNPFNSEADGLATREDTSIAQEVAKVAPASATVFKAFNTIFRHVLEKGRPLDVFIAGDDAQAKAGVEMFIESLGLRPLDVGGLKRAHWLEAASLVEMALARNGVGNWDLALGVTEFHG